MHDPGRVVLQKAYSLAALLAEGATSRVIADTLVVTLDTVTRHVTDVFGESQGGQPDPGGRALARDLGLLR